MPEPAYPAMPTIPVQRALIVHRNGEETLVVESAFETHSPQVGWILPLPSEPTKLEVGEPGMLASLAMSMRPDLTHDLSQLWRFAGLALLMMIPVAVGMIYYKDPAQRRHELLKLAAIYVFGAFVASILLPSLGTAGVDAIGAAVTVRGAQQVGNYEVTVLRTGQGAALSQWADREETDAARSAGHGHR